MNQQSNKYHSFKEFYPFYLGEHSHPVNRTLHFIGSLFGLSLVTVGPILQGVWSLPWFLLLGLLNGYAFAWFGHFVFEKNRPATFTYPWYSFLGDWVMFKDLLTGREKFKS